MDHPPRRSAIYARVSSDRQEREETVESQLEALRAYAEAKGYRQPTEFVDEGRSGYTLSRPALDRLRDAVAAGAFDVVLIHEIGRLARERFDQALLLRELRQRTRVEFAKHPSDNTPEGELIENVLGDFAHFEGKLIADRTRRGKLHWLRQGALMGGFIPYGYRYLPRDGERRASMEIDEMQAAIVREMFTWLVQERLSCRAIGKRLTARGVPTNRGGTAWHASVISRILRNEAYVGRFHYGKAEGVEPKRPRTPAADRARRKTSRSPLPRDQWLTIPVPPIVDEETFARAQLQLDANARLSPRNNKRHHWLLRGLIRCGRCGGAYSGAVSRERRYYRCNARDRFTVGPNGVCPAHTIRADEAEATVWNTVVGLLQPDVLAQEYRRRTTEADGPHESEVRKLKAALKAAERQERRWLDAYQAEAIDVGTLKARMNACKTQRQAIAAQEAALADATSRRQAQTQALASLQAFCREVGEGLADLDFEGKRRVLELMVEHVVVDGDNLRIELAIPLDRGPDGGASRRPDPPAPADPSLRLRTLGTHPDRQQQGLDRRHLPWPEPQAPAVLPGRILLPVQ